MTSFFSIFVDNIKNQFVVHLDHIPPPAKGNQCEGSTPLKESHNNHFKLKACTLHAQVHVQENSAKFLVMLQAEEVQ